MEEYPTGGALRSLTGEQVEAIWQRWSGSQDDPEYQSARTTLVTRTDQEPLDPEVGQEVDRLAAAHPDRAEGLVEAVVLASLAHAGRQHLSSAQYTAVLGPWRAGQRPATPAGPPQSAATNPYAAPRQNPAGPTAAPGATPWAPAGSANRPYATRGPASSTGGPRPGTTGTAKGTTTPVGRVVFYVVVVLVAISVLRGCTLDFSSSPSFEPDFDFPDWDDDVSLDIGTLATEWDVLQTPTEEEPVTRWRISATAENGTVYIATVEDIVPEEFFVPGCDVSIERRATHGTAIARPGGFWSLSNLEEGQTATVTLRAEGAACPEGGIDLDALTEVPAYTETRSIEQLTAGADGGLNSLSLVVVVEGTGEAVPDVVISDAVPDIAAPDCTAAVVATNGSDALDLQTQEWTLGDLVPNDFQVLSVVFSGQGCPAAEELREELLAAGWQD